MKIMEFCHAIVSYVLERKYSGLFSLNELVGDLQAWLHRFQWRKQVYFFPQTESDKLTRIILINIPAKLHVKLNLWKFDEKFQLLNV